MTWGTNENPAVAIPRKTKQRLMRCGPAEVVSTTSSRGRPKSEFLSAQLSAISRFKTPLYLFD